MKYKQNERLMFLLSAFQDRDAPVSLLSCSPKAITGRAEAKKMYIVGAKILRNAKKHQVD